MSELRCRGSTGGDCGLPPGKDGRIILSSATNTLWVLCKRHAADYEVNLRICLGLGDVEVTEEDAELMITVGEVMSR